jgi:Txe/YoeB family toxin of Txe-Axe toxin-antitoxin module
MNENNNKNTQFEYKITFTKKSLGDLKKLQKNKTSLLKFNEIYEELKVNPYSPYFKFEKLKYNNSGLYSK